MGEDIYLVVTENESLRVVTYKRIVKVLWRKEWIGQQHNNRIVPCMVNYSSMHMGRAPRRRRRCRKTMFNHPSSRIFIYECGTPLLIEFNLFRREQEEVQVKACLERVK